MPHQSGVLLAYSAAMTLLAGGACVQADTTPVPVGDPSAQAAYFLPPKEGGVRRWQSLADRPTRLLDEPAETAGTVAVLSGETILRNYGCEETGGRMWCAVKVLRGEARGFIAADNLEPARGPDGIIAVGPDDSDKRARRRQFDAETKIPCAQEQGQALGTCDIGVARGTGGDATVVATFQNGFSRRLFFVHGEFTAGNTTMSGNGTDTDWQLTEGVHAIRVDDQRFEIPNDILVGR